MSWERMLDVLSNCQEMCDVFTRQPYFYITGGDPILHPDFWRLLETLGAKRIPFTVMGNPFHLSDEACARMKACGCEKYQLSLDGTRETHDWFRQPGSFDCTLEKIAVIKRAGIRSVVMATVSGRNVREVPDLIDMVVERGADVFAFARYCQVNGEKDTGMTAGEYRRLLDICYQKFQAYESAGVNTYFSKKDHLWTLYEYERGTFSVPQGAEDGVVYGGCNCGNSHLTILPNGDLYACRRFESKAGNAFEDRIAQVWMGERMEAYRDYSRFAKCGTCVLLRFCRGCPAVAYGVTGDYYGADPHCWKNIKET
jgi:radical SAM/SPASM domain protein of ACGX system